jgi:hypothetical protein
LAYGEFKDTEKIRELKEDTAKFIIAFDKNNNNKPVAFTHFRFDIEDEREVIYWLVLYEERYTDVVSYEIQLDNSVQGKGLGKFMMQVGCYGY